MKIIEQESDLNGVSVYMVEVEFTNEETPQFIEEMMKRPRLRKAMYEALVEGGYITPHGET